VTVQSSAMRDNVVALPIPDDDLVRLAPGEYLAVYAGCVSVRVFKTVKVRVDFRLLAHPELILPRWYRVIDSRGGRVRAPRHGDLVREISAVLGRRIRCDRVPVSALESVVVRAEVRDVIADRKQDRLAPMNVYSVIGRLAGRE
jgi:hypothetical protein